MIKDDGVILIYFLLCYKAVLTIRNINFYFLYIHTLENRTGHNIRDFQGTYVMSAVLSLTIQFYSKLDTIFEINTRSSHAFKQ